MRHRNHMKKLGRSVAHRKAMIRNLLTSLLTEEKIQTTQTRCKVLKREVEKLITLGKRNTLNARRIAASRLYTKEAVARLFDEIAPRFQDRQGGYTRIMLTGPRRGDAAEMGIIELLPTENAPAVADNEDDSSEE
jgi:large subunit ribosomal protein L17